MNVGYDMIGRVKEAAFYNSDSFLFCQAINSVTNGLYSLQTVVIVYYNGLFEYKICVLLD